MKLYQVDAFTKAPFKGNPAGVCIVDNFPDTSIMQAISFEMNLSETAFVETGRGEFHIRYFTPVCEVPLCGHATLASAHILYELGVIQQDNSFTLKARDVDLYISNENSWIKMIFPVYELEVLPDRRRLDAILGVTSLDAYRSKNGWIVVRVATEKDVLDARPDFEAIRRENTADLLAVTAPPFQPQYDFVVRVFCNPECGITEDPVTGSANCILAPYWHRILKKTKFSSKQLSKRTGELEVALADNKVEISGQAVTVFTIDACNMPQNLIIAK